MKRIGILTVLFLLFAVNASAQTISGLITEKCLKVGKEASGKIIIEIPEELHINSNEVGNEFSIPTTLKLNAEKIEIKKIIFPKGIDRKFEFSETPLNVYEKRVEINFSFVVPQDFTDKTVNIRAVVGYQACTNEVCYPPRKETVNLTAKVE